MAITLINSQNSFIRFDEPSAAQLCIWGSVDYCLPVYDESDIAFQFVLVGTEEEIDQLCGNDVFEDKVQFSLINNGDCDGEPLIVFSEYAQRYRLSATQMLYNWPHGVPGFSTVVAINKCFQIRVLISLPYQNSWFCSNCFERIADDCFTSVIEYGNDEDAFGFKYCYGGDLNVPAVGVDCSPTIIQFINQATLTIPYTSILKDKYGDAPVVQVWIYDSIGQLINMGITAAFDAYPVTVISLDFGGTATGIVIIR
jgi:hypothetical protein